MNQAQLRCATSRMIFQGRAYKKGEVFWTAEHHAKMLIDAGLCKLVGQDLPGPNAPAAPGTGTAEKKSAAAAPGGRSTGGPRSSAHGSAARSSASAPAPASAEPKAPRKSRARKLLGDAADKAKTLFS